eukprot:scaffold7091_cov73-Cylindrotheca_fusiformis.AAC.1
METFRQVHRQTAATGTTIYVFVHRVMPLILLLLLETPLKRPSRFLANPNVSLVAVDQETCSMENNNNKLDQLLEETIPLFHPSCFMTTMTNQATTTTTPNNPAFLSEEALRMTVECLQLQAAAG